jgi:putative copper resistance protein D
MAVIILRFVEYAAASLLFGAPLFLLYSRLEGFSWTRPLLGSAALTVAAAAPLHFLAQTAEVAEALDAATLKAAFLEMDFGKASLVRGAAGLLALAVTVIAGKQYKSVAACGAIACASFSWMGHGAATQGAAGWIHLGGDILHTLAAAAWIGALAVMAAWLMQKSPDPRPLLKALRDFSAFGVLFVATLIVTGLVNSWFLIGIGRLTDFWQSLYGQVLLVKILLFLAMLGLAARNRTVHVPGLEAQSGTAAIAALKRSVLAEAGLGVVILVLVAWLGMLPPPASGV